VFDDSPVTTLRSAYDFAHSRQGAALWERTKAKHQGQQYAARYCLADLAEISSWTLRSNRDLYTSPHLFAAVEQQMGELRMELMQDAALMPGGAGDTSKGLLRSKSRKIFGAMVGETRHFWQGGKRGSYETETLTGRRVPQRFHEKKTGRDRHGRRKRYSFASRTTLGPCTCTPCTAAAVVQRVWRGHRGRCRAASARAERCSATLLQALARAHVAMVDTESLRNDAAAASIIQYHWVCWQRRQCRAFAAAVTVEDLSSTSNGATLEAEGGGGAGGGEADQEQPSSDKSAEITTATSITLLDRTAPDWQVAPGYAERVFLHGASISVASAAWQSGLFGELSAAVLSQQRRESAQLRAQMSKWIALRGQPAAAAVDQDPYARQQSRTSNQRSLGDVSLRSIILRGRSLRSGAAKGAQISRNRPSVGESTRPVSAPPQLAVFGGGLTGEGREGHATSL
jgi:hypothetical protein